MISRLRRWIADLSPPRRLTLMLLLTSLGLTHCAPMTWNDESRMATIQAVVESHTLVIDQTDFVGTGDKVFIAGHFFSDKPPFPSFLGAAIYLPLYQVGLRLHEGPSLSYFLITFFTMGIAWMVGSYAFFVALGFTGLHADRRLLATIALSVGTTFLPWSTTFNNHGLAASFLAVAFCFFLKAKHENRVATNLALAGGFFSLAGSCDIPTGVFFIVFLISILATPRLRPRVAFFLSPLLVTVGPTMVIDYLLHGSVLPVQITAAYFQYPGSPWIGSTELSGVAANTAAFTANYALATLFGGNGFLLYNPLLFIALASLTRILWKRQRFWQEALCIATGSLVLMVYYWITTTNFGGWSYSIRWFVPLIPLLLFFLYPFLLQFRELRRKRAFYALLGVSVMIAFVGALNPWSPRVYSDIGFVANIKQAVAHLQHPYRIQTLPRQ